MDYGLLDFWITDYGSWMTGLLDYWIMHQQIVAHRDQA